MFVATCAYSAGSPLSSAVFPAELGIRKFAFDGIGVALTKKMSRGGTAFNCPTCSNQVLESDQSLPDVLYLIYLRRLQKSVARRKTAQFLDASLQQKDNPLKASYNYDFRRKKCGYYLK